MENYIEVVTDETDLTRTVWAISYKDFRGATLHSWRSQTRETKRHKFKASQSDGTAWLTVGARNNRIPRPTIPDDVKAEALRLFAASLKFAVGE